MRSLKGTEFLLQCRYFVLCVFEFNAEGPQRCPRTLPLRLSVLTPVGKLLNLGLYLGGNRMECTLTLLLLLHHHITPSTQYTGV